MTESLKKKLDKLREEYITSLPGKVKKVTHLVKQIRTNHWNSEKRDILINLIHRMVGSGKTFGVDKLTDVAFELEKLLKEKLKANKIVTMSLKNEINEYVEKLDTIAQKTGYRESAGYNKISQQKIDNTTLMQEKKAFLFLQEQMNNTLKDQFKMYGYSLTRCNKIEDIEKFTPLGRNVIILFEIHFLEKEKINLEKIIELCGEKKGINIVVLSDDDTLKKRLTAARIGADVFMTSPFDVSVLINKLYLIEQNRGSEPYHILIVDDDIEFVAWCAYTLQKEGMVTSVVTKPEYVISELIESRPELVLMDWHMPGYTGFDLASIIRQQDAFISIPIIFLTAESDSKKRMKAMRIGADDFLIKPISPGHLVEAVKIRAERYRTLRFYMERDSLTGLYNHSKILEFLSTEISRANRYEIPLSFAMVDIDFFKNVNDTYGHLNGDKVLKDLANLFKERLRKNDLIGRYGGEEFAVIFPNTEPQAVVNVLNEIRKSFAKMIHRADEKCFSVTFSAGVTSSQHCKDTQKIIHVSDIALYKAKSRGRNRIELEDTP